MNYLSYYYLIELIHQCSCNVVGAANAGLILISMISTGCGATYILLLLLLALIMVVIMSAHNYLHNCIWCFLILSYIILGPIINTRVKPKQTTGKK